MNDSGNDAECQSDLGEEPAKNEAAYVAKLVRGDGAQSGDLQTDEVGGETGSAATQEPEIRVGSPFKIDPPTLAASDALVAGSASGEAAYGEFGPFLYTAMGASAAGVLVLFFAGIGAWWFPPGGALVSVLGAILSIVGLFSTRRFRYAAIATLPIHMGLFFVCYARALS